MCDERGDHRGRRGRGDVCIRGQTKPKSSAVARHTTSGLKTPDKPHAHCKCTSAYTASLHHPFTILSPVHRGRSGGCRVHTGWRSAAAISANEKKAQVTTAPVFFWRTASVCHRLHQVVPSTAASGCRSPSPQEPNRASLRTRASPVKYGQLALASLLLRSPFDTLDSLGWE